MVRILKNLFGVSRDDFGGKAEGLAWLTKVNAPIPPTLCISANQEDINTLCQNDELLSATKDWIDGISAKNKFVGGN